MEADTTDVARARFAISAETFALLSYVALAALFLIVVSGATVRLTGSGLGCDNWPRCGVVIPSRRRTSTRSSSSGTAASASSSASSRLPLRSRATRVERLPRWLLWARGRSR